MQIGQYDSDSCHPDRSNPIFSSHLTSCEMVGLRSGGTSLLFPWVGGCLGGSALPCHPDRSNPIFSSHLTSCEMVGLRSGVTSLLFPWVGAWEPWWVSPPLSSRPKQPNFFFPSHFLSDGCV